MQNISVSLLFGRVQGDGMTPVSVSSGDLVGLEDVDGFGDLPGAPGAAAEFARTVLNRGRSVTQAKPGL
jgi:hypothetical protein